MRYPRIPEPFTIPRVGGTLVAVAVAHHSDVDVNVNLLVSYTCHLSPCPHGPSSKTSPKLLELYKDLPPIMGNAWQWNVYLEELIMHGPASPAAARARIAYGKTNVTVIHNSSF